MCRLLFVFAYCQNLQNSTLRKLKFCVLTKMEILHSKMEFCTQKMHIWHSKNCNGTLNRPPRIQHSEKGNSPHTMESWFFHDFTCQIGQFHTILRCQNSTLSSTVIESWRGCFVYLYYSALNYDVAQCTWNYWIPCGITGHKLIP